MKIAAHKASTVLLLLLSFCAAYAQKKPPQKPVNRDDDDDVIRINTNVVQVDAVVTDKNGKVVTGLTRDDFELVEDGRKFLPEYFSFVPLLGQRTADDPAPDALGQLSVGQLRRTFVFLVDNPLIDLAYIDTTIDRNYSRTLSFRPRAIRSAVEAEKVLRWFVDTQMGANDLAAISDTEVNIGVLQSFTNDREVLHAAIQKLKDNLNDKHRQTIRILALKTDPGIQALVVQNLTVIKTIGNVIDQLEQLPGRKVIALLSRGMLYDPRLPGSDIVRQRLSEVITKANRARVTFYTLSPNGVGNLGGANSLVDAVQDLDSLIYLARETGGRAIYNTNDTRLGLEKILEENKGYYMLGYNPGSEAVGRPHKIVVTLRRAGFTVTSRSSAYAGTTTGTPNSPGAALNSPLAVRDIKLTLTTLPVDHQNAKLASVLHVDLSGVPLKPEMSTLDLLIRVTGPDGKTKDEAKKISFQSRPDISEAERSKGLETQIGVESVTPGFYRISVAVTEPESGLTGSLTKFVNVKM